MKSDHVQVPACIRGAPLTGGYSICLHGKVPFAASSMAISRGPQVSLPLRAATQSLLVYWLLVLHVQNRLDCCSYCTCLAELHCQWQAFARTWCMAPVVCVLFQEQDIGRHTTEAESNHKSACSGCCSCSGSCQLPRTARLCTGTHATFVRLPSLSQLL